MDYPVVSVIIPTYNYGHYILEAIDSVLKQTYPISKIEIIVIDDGSSDDTLEVLQPLIDEKSIRYYFQSNKGKANATCHAIKKSTGKYILNLDADDYFLPQKLEQIVSVFEAYSDVVHVAAPANFVNENKEIINSEQFPEDILEKPLDGNWLLHRFYNSHILFGGGSTYAARASILKQITIPDEVDMYIDEFLIMAILPYGKSFFLKEPLSVWRAHSYNYSGAGITIEQKIKKGERLLKSSAAILRYVEQKHFSDRIKKIYKLIDATRMIAHKETINKKVYLT